jgi:uncharacterized repeat protein (TIGR01451 family)
VVTAVCILFSTLVFAPSGSATPKGVDGAIVFFRNGPSDAGIYKTRAGLSPVKLVNISYSVSGLSWSPHGDRIVYSTQGYDWELDVMNKDGSNRHSMYSPSNAGAKWPAWSPTAGRILFTRSRVDSQYYTHEDLWLVDTDGGNAHALTATKAINEEAAAWSPNGKRIAFVGVGAKTQVSHLYVMDADGSHRRLVADYGFDPSWSSDGSHIAFARGDLYTVRPNGTGLRRITYISGLNDRSAADPAWSPEGSAIAFQLQTISKTTLWTVPASGGTAGPLTAGPHDTQADWQPLRPSASSADLGVSQTAPARPILAGRDVAFHVMVRNRGPAPAKHVKLTDGTPPGSTIRSAVGKGGFNCQRTSQQVTCSMGSLARGESARLDLVVRSSHPATLRNRAGVTSTSADPVQGNDHATALAAVRSSSRRIPSDFNGDGRQDLAVAQQAYIQAAVGFQPKGAISFALHTGNGLDLKHAGYAGDIYPYSWGWSLASGDFDGDGFADLAGGAPQAIRRNKSVGAVGVLYGSAGGLDRDTWQYFDESGIGAEPRQYEWFGSAVAAGDFNHDGKDDLAVGAWQEAGHVLGAVFVIPGSSKGLRPAKARKISGRTAGLAGRGLDGNYFGYALASGDFNDDHRADLAIGAITAGVNPGAVYVLPGSRTGLTTKGSRRFDEASPGIPSRLDPSEGFGNALAVGNFGRGDQDDLAVGAPGESGRKGAVFVLFGSKEGLHSKNAQELTQASPGVPGSSQMDGGFGEALAAGNLNGKSSDDLAVGVYQADHPGAVITLYGSRTGLTAKGSRKFEAGKGGVPGSGADHDEFGSVLAVLDMGRGGPEDLAVGAPYDDNGTYRKSSGSVTLLFGSTSGIAANGARRVIATDLNVPTGLSQDQRLGIGLA